jgi:hypothetical protein
MQRPPRIPQSGDDCQCCVTNTFASAWQGGLGGARRQSKDSLCRNKSADDEMEEGKGAAHTRYLRRNLARNTQRPSSLTATTFTTPTLPSVPININSHHPPCALPPSSRQQSAPSHPSPTLQSPTSPSPPSSASANPSSRTSQLPSCSPGIGSSSGEWVLPAPK